MLFSLTTMATTPKQISFSVTTAKPASAKADVVVLVVDDTLTLPGGVSDAAAQRATGAMQKVKFKGGWGAAELFVMPGETTFYAVAGIGSKAAPAARQAEGLRRALGAIVQDARKHMLHRIAVVLPDTKSAPQLAAAAYEGIGLANYRFIDHLPRLANEQKERATRQVLFFTSRRYAPAVRESVEYAQIVLAGVTLARDLVNQPASHMSPAALVREARRIAGTSPRLSVTVLNRQQAQRKKFTAFLAVARGSKEEPYVIHLKYKPAKKATKKIFLVGKGVTFDSGGLSLKPSQHMETMKIDMGGAATVLGVFSALTKLPMPVEVHGVIAACENMPSGDAYRPGDVVTAKNGKTIEVLNTDAEGRITLADALSYAVEHKPTAVVDVATLTGASMVALGDTHAGLWSNSQALQNQLLAAAQEAGEGLAALPLPDEYRQTIQSKVADVRNVATMERMGGAITAALFLQEFVGNTSWAHIDLAGPVFAERPLLSYYTYGATGYGVRTLIEFLKKFDK